MLSASADKFVAMCFITENRKQDATTSICCSANYDEQATKRPQSSMTSFVLSSFADGFWEI